MYLPPWFITATDTDAGKTWMSVQILHKLRAQNYQAIGIKPIASGGNLDKSLLQNASSSDLGANHGLYEFAPAIAPHFAAKLENVDIDLHKIKQHIDHIQQHQPTAQLVIEGAGGWRVPLNDHEEWQDLLKITDWQVILIVGIKLGCLNHALLTAESLCASGAAVMGWLPNVGANPDPYAEAMIETLRVKMPFEYLSAELAWILPKIDDESDEKAKSK